MLLLFHVVFIRIIKLHDVRVVEDAPDDRLEAGNADRLAHVGE